MGPLFTFWIKIDAYLSDTETNTCSFCPWSAPRLVTGSRKVEIRYMNEKKNQNWGWGVAESRDLRHLTYSGLNCTRIWPKSGQQSQSCTKAGMVSVPGSVHSWEETTGGPIRALMQSCAEPSALSPTVLLVEDLTWTRPGMSGCRIRYHALGNSPSLHSYSW